MFFGRRVRCQGKRGRCWAPRWQVVFAALVATSGCGGSEVSSGDFVAVVGTPVLADATAQERFGVHVYGIRDQNGAWVMEAYGGEAWLGSARFAASSCGGPGTLESWFADGSRASIVVVS